jgi:hypothetical protein
MLVLPDHITIFDVRANCPVSAWLVRLTRELAVTRIDGTWWKIPVSKRVRKAEEDHHWSWKQVVGKHRNDIVRLLALHKQLRV